MSGCILDNLSSDKVSGVEEAMHATGAILLYLPPYSPDFNPIEKLSSKLKALLGKAALNDLSIHCGRNRRPAQCRYTRRMLKLLHLLRLCKHLNRNRSRTLPASEILFVRNCPMFIIAK